MTPGAGAPKTTEPPSTDVLDLVRGLPADAVRRLLEELLLTGDGPRCAEAQADGTPCTSAQTDCTRCRRFLEAVDRLRSTVQG